MMLIMRITQKFSSAWQSFQLKAVKNLKMDTAKNALLALEECFAHCCLLAASMALLLSVLSAHKNLYFLMVNALERLV